MNDDFLNLFVHFESIISFMRFMDHILKQIFTYPKILFVVINQIF